MTEAKTLDRNTEAKLQALLAKRQTIPAGRLQFVNLAPVRERFGDQWPTIAKRANAMATTVITRYLAKADMFIAVDELAYLLLFGELSEDEAQIKCGLIASEISRHLLGEEAGLDDVEIQTVVVEAEASRDDSTVHLDDFVGRVAARADEKAAETAGPPPEPEAVAEDTAAEIDTLLSDIEFIYRPLWDVKRKALSTYLCVPKLDGGPALGTRTGYDVLRGMDASAFITSLDLASLDRVTHNLRHLERRNQKLLVTCAVHYETLRASRRRLAYLERCGRLTEYQRQLLIFEVAGLPEDVPHTRLLELIGPLDPYSRARTVRTTANRRDFEVLHGLHIHAVGIDLTENYRPESEIFGLFNQFAEAAARTKLRTFVHGLRSLSLAAAAVCAGFDYVDGDAVTSVTGSPDSIYRFQSQDLFRALMK